MSDCSCFNVDFKQFLVHFTMSILWTVMLSAMLSNSVKPFWLSCLRCKSFRWCMVTFLAISDLAFIVATNLNRVFLSTMTCLYINLLLQFLC